MLMPSKLTDTEKKIKAAVSLLEKHGYTVTPPSQPVVVDVTEVNRRKLEERRQAFIKELSKYQGTYSNGMLNAFFAYWSEPNKSFTKMRYELERTWSLRLRLSNWYNRNKSGNYGRKQVTDEERRDRLADILVG